MKIKKEYVILFAVIVVISFYLLGRSPDRTGYRLPEISEVGKGAVTRIEISMAETSITIDKKGDGWQIEPAAYPADAEKVKDMLGTIEDLSLTALVSESSSYDRYDLGDEKKISVRAFSGDRKVRDFEIGKAASSYRHTFLKLAGDHRVYHAEGNFRQKFDQTADALRDKGVLSFDRNEIEEIHLDNGKEKVALARAKVPVDLPASAQAGVKAGKEGGEQDRPEAAAQAEIVWKTGDGRDSDKDQISKLLNALSDLKCEEFISEGKKEDFTDPIYTIGLKGPREYRLSIFDKQEKDAGSYPAVSSENNYPFLLPEWQVKILTESTGDIIKRMD